MHGDETVCLSPDQLIAFQEGRLDEALRARLERHVSECPRCSSRVESLSRPGGSELTHAVGDPESDDTWAGLLLNVPPAEAGTPEATVASAEMATWAAPQVDKAASESGRPGPGRRLGPYLLREKLGAGGMGIVFEAFDQERNARVALKVLPRVDAKTLYLFKREFRALADLFHPNLVALYEFGCESGHWFITMERVDGSDFLAYVRPRAHEPGDESTLADRSVSTVRESAAGVETEETQPIPAAPEVEPEPEPLLSTRGEPEPASEETVRMGGPGGAGGLPRVLDLTRLRASIRQLAEGVEALHAAGKLHRDLKPSNVMVTHQGRVVLLDFGLIAELAIPSFDDGSRPEVDEPSQYDSDGSVASGAGTVSYMAPEQALGEPLTGACDWYAMGVILYEALTGRKPFTGSSFRLLREKLAADPVPPGALNPSTPPDLRISSASTCSADAPRTGRPGPRSSAGSARRPRRPWPSPSGFRRSGGRRSSGASGRWRC